MIIHDDGDGDDDDDDANDDDYDAYDGDEEEPPVQATSIMSWLRLRCFR